MEKNTLKILPMVAAQALISVQAVSREKFLLAKQKDDNLEADI